MRRMVIAALALLAVGSAPAATAATTAEACDPTQPNGSTPPDEQRSRGWHGNGKLWTNLLGLRGERRIGTSASGRPPTHGGEVNADGSATTRVLWIRSEEAGRTIKVRGHMLGDPSTRLRARVPGTNAGPSSGWFTVLTFARSGCWRVTATAGEARLSVRLRVVIGEPTAESSARDATAAAPARVGCGEQSSNRFGRQLENYFRIGPLFLNQGLRDASGYTPETLERSQGYVKAQLVLRPGRRATLSIAPESRDAAQLLYGDERHHTLRFRSCGVRTASSSAAGRPVTFWSGGLVMSASPACVALIARLDNQRTRRWRVPVGPGACDD